MTGRELKALIAHLEDSAEVWIESSQADDLVTVEFFVSKEIPKCSETKAKIRRKYKPTTSSDPIASAMAKKRWDNTTKAQRQAIVRKLNEARKRKREENGR